ncbi:hypothetical protein EYB53_003675 [Candidatus Chloroploca sp. M-50]|uniref:Uncharacterized protein n=2 Tax=Candidatus Chloroploca TaxID=1579476 RepID=A0A2H3L8W0_9CHLR|nr:MULTISPECIES: hypothetical protein [Candidatus Chloroploca]MBP1464803.1 hypothetical protein [Candidatus Chloroploca mongolica]NCC32274.1 hypothetical protein [Chloroflexia bacterium]PDV99760.1 hypothetical protein A9Q02_00660 [Candidatus Chloroploca asiatica]
MPAGLGEATQMIGPITPALMCWASLIITVLALGLTFFWTNITAFARRARNGQRVPTAGSVVKRSER